MELDLGLLHHDVQNAHTKQQSPILINKKRGRKTFRTITYILASKMMKINESARKGSRVVILE